jgi:protein-S-isoprenylcysteine O-methyltransferase Ste14
MDGLKQLRAIFFLPVMVTLVIPALLVWSEGMNAGWGLALPWFLFALAASIALVALGIFLLVKTIALFARVGQGTLAPWDPTQRLVVRGIYRHVRNPMISGVFAILLGEALLFGSTRLVAWLCLFVLANLLYIPFVEEASMQARFGDAYARYKQNVPRWIPRWRAWNPDSDEPARPNEGL